MKTLRSMAALAVTLLVVLGLGTAPAHASTIYYYAAGQQSFVGGATIPTQLTANVTGYNPALDTTAPNTEGHTLVEIAVQSADTQQAVELGMRKAPGDAGQKVFVHAYRNGTPCGYGLTNLCGTGVNFVECNGAPSNCAGNPDVWDVTDLVTNGTTYKLGIVYNATTPAGGAWWVYFYTSGGTAEWLGYFPSGLWSVAFTTAPRIHAYGEVAPDTGVLGCTDMGDGTLATSAVGGLIGSVSAAPVANTAIDIDQTTVITDATKYNFAAAVPGTNVRTVRYGGPGAC